MVDHTCKIKFYLWRSRRRWMRTSRRNKREALPRIERESFNYRRILRSIDWLVWACKRPIFFVDRNPQAGFGESASFRECSLSKNVGPWVACLEKFYDIKISIRSLSTDLFNFNSQRIQMKIGYTGKNLGVFFSLYYYFLWIFCVTWVQYSVLMYCNNSQFLNVKIICKINIRVCQQFNTKVSAQIQNVFYHVVHLKVPSFVQPEILLIWTEFW